MIYPQKKNNLYAQKQAALKQRDQQAKQVATQVADVAGMAFGVPGAGKALGAVDSISSSLTKKDDGSYKSGGAEFADRLLNPMSKVTTGMDFLQTGNMNDVAAVMTFGLAGGETTAEKRLKSMKAAERDANMKATQQGGRAFYGQMPKYKPTLYSGGGKLGDVKKDENGRYYTSDKSLGYESRAYKPKAYTREGNETVNALYREGFLGNEHKASVEDRQEFWGSKIKTTNPYTGEEMPYSALHSLLQAPGQGRKFREQFARNREPQYVSPQAYLQHSFDTGKKAFWETARSNPDQNILETMRFARGGSILLGGKSHARGGNPIVDTKTGQVVAETEKGELLYERKATEGIEKGVQYIQQHGNKEVPVEGGERVYSKKDTKKILSLARKKKFEQLGKHVYEATVEQDKRPPEFKA